MKGKVKIMPNYYHFPNAQILLGDVGPMMSKHYFNLGVADPDGSDINQHCFNLR